MYGAISSVSVLASGGQVIRPDWSFLAGGKPVVWYGTSITQGGVSPRPGHAYTNRIARGINREVLNFGQSKSKTLFPTENLLERVLVGCFAHAP